MDRRSRISLDNPTFRGRLRADVRGDYYGRPSPRPALGGIKDMPAVQPNTHHIPPNLKLNPSSTAIQVVKIPAIKHKISPSQKSVHHLPKQSRSAVLKRQSVKSLPKTFRPKHRRPLMPVLLSGMAVMLFSFGLIVVFHTVRTNKNADTQVKGLSQQIDDGSIENGIPSEDEPPADIGSYSVAPDMPRVLKIEKIEVNARIKKLGVNAYNALKAPGNIFDVGWYDESAKPGENGTIVLDGHVSGPTKNGVFYKIGSLSVGDKIEVERGDKKIFTYTVTGLEIFDNNKVDMPKVLTTSVAGKPGLNLITCTGRFNVRTNSFEKRAVVYSVQD